MPENPLTRRGRRLLVAVAGILFLALVAATWYAYGKGADPVLLTYCWVGSGTLIHFLYAITRDRRFEHLPVAAGRMVAVVPAYEQDHDDLRACIWSILNQRGVVVDEVHVVDDGSIHRPVDPFPHPRVRWHRTGNGGKQAAQIYVLDRLDPHDWDFVLTADGDCVLDEQAIEHQLRAFSRPGIVATTAMVAVRNAEDNLLTRVVDLHNGTRVMRRVSRARRSPTALATVTSGALTICRADTLFEQKRRWIAAKAIGQHHGDAAFADLDGDVVRVHEAIVWTRVPTDVVATYRQRRRSATAAWRRIAPAPARARLPRNVGRLMLILRLAFGPPALGSAVIITAEVARRDALRLLPVVAYAVLYLLVRYAMTGLHLIQRPGPGNARIRTWILLTPVEAAYHLAFSVPIKYLALLRFREVDRTASADPSKVYYSGYLIGAGTSPTPASGLGDGHE
ncbi:glycosyltransferase [Actinoplanes sp. M2I2]|uniref:glycosyltransferase family 2 protein n=1 Tax=Actinoplanes sp. M2I2 TaxID=1734444 RepID=UPI002022422B|nr:glycosyltransferase [Actinoplanes sp. M2I2]